MRRLLLLVLMAFAAISGSLVAQAAPPAFCQSYARLASAQYEESRVNGCGLFGGRWQESLDAHYNWCRGTPVEQVELEEAYRTDALRACRRALPVEPPAPPPPDRRAECRDYARTAVKQNEAQELLGCGFRGGRWQSNEANHFNWCLTAQTVVAKEQTDLRATDVRSCKAQKEAERPRQRPGLNFSIDLSFGQGRPIVSGPKATFCQNYANEAIRQNQRQEWLGCGYFGNRWWTNRDAHFRYCMNNPRSASLRELDARKVELRQCSGDGR